jgi:hypothetical protein
MEYVISHSFSQFQHENQLPQLEAKLMSLKAEASSITAAADEVAQEYNSLVKVSSLVNFFYPLIEACLRPCASLPNASHLSLGAGQAARNSQEGNAATRSLRALPAARPHRTARGRQVPFIAHAWWQFSWRDRYHKNDWQLT